MTSLPAPCRTISSGRRLPFILTLALLSACSPHHPAIVLVTLEGVRSSDLKPAGEGSGALPALRGLAKRGWSATCAITPSPDSPVAAASLLSGLPPSSHGLLDGSASRVRPDAPLLGVELKRAGYSAAAFIGSRSITWQSGLSRGFDRFEGGPADTLITSEPLAVKPARGWDPEGRRRDPSEVVQDALRWLRRHKGPAFTWLHIATRPASPGATEEKLRSDVANSIAEIDSAMTQLLQGLEDLGLAQRTVIAVAGTSGHGRGEHGEWTSGLGLYETTVRVPLVIAGPGIVPGASDAPLSTVCLTPLLRRAAGIASSPSAALGAAAGEAISVTFVPQAEFGWRARASLRTNRWSYVDSGEQELYDRQSDPGEERNLAPVRKQETSALASRLKAARPFRDEGASEGAAVSPEVQRRVLSLLIEAGTAASKNDPKAAQSRVAEALALSEGNPAACRLLARLRQASGDHEEAMEALEPLRRAAASSSRSALALAGALQEIGELDEAVSVIRKALEHSRTTSRMRVALAEALARKKAHENAADMLKSVSEQESDDPCLLEKLGDEYLASGNAYRAATSYESALRLGFHDPSLLMKMGDSRLKLNDARGALEAFREVSGIDPSSLVAHLRQGDALLALEKPDEALAEYRKSLPQSAGGFEEGMTLGDRLVERRLDKMAFSLYQDMALVEPKRFEPHYRIGEMMLRRGRLKEAEAAFRYALGLAPDNPAIQYQLARIALSRKDEAEALRLVRLLAQKGGEVWLKQAAEDPLFRGLPETSELRKALSARADKGSGQSLRLLSVP